MIPKRWFAFINPINADIIVTCAVSNLACDLRFSHSNPFLSEYRKFQIYFRLTSPVIWYSKQTLYKPFVHIPKNPSKHEKPFQTSLTKKQIALFWLLPSLFIHGHSAIA